MGSTRKRKKSSLISKMIRRVILRSPKKKSVISRKKSSNKSSKKKTGKLLKKKSPLRKIKSKKRAPKKASPLISKKNGLRKTRKKAVQKTVKNKKITKKQNILARTRHNPIISPIEENEWESWQTFNPAALFENGKVHFLYRALGPDGVSRLGHAASTDGLQIDERSSEPAYVVFNRPRHHGTCSLYETLPYTSGGGWAGCEDPRATRIGDTIYMLYVAFDYVGLPRIALTSIDLKDFLAKRWKWKGARIISPSGVVDKSGVLFPEKIKGKYVIMHRVFPNILIDFVDSLDFKGGEYLKGKYSIKIRKKHWDSRKIGAGAPPIKTKYGWLLIYYAVDDKDDGKYKMGAMILDLKNPVKVLHRTDEPILEPIKWYENEGHKAGVVYPCGAVVKNGKLFIYYGGADSHVCVASANLEKFLKSLMEKKKAKLRRVTRKK